MEQHVLAHVVNRLSNAKIHPYPYPHFYIDHLFPDDYYQELLANLPSTASYQAISKTGKVDPRTYGNRFVLPLLQEELNQLPFFQFLFWSKFAEGITSEPFCGSLLQKFDDPIKQRFGAHYENVKFSPIAELVRDHTNYSIGPHTDHPIRVVTLLFYFPNSTDLAHLGTSIYEPLDPAFECEGFEHHSFSQFKKLETMSFCPNAVFGFARSNRSFHGREPILDQNVERNLMNYYLQWNQR